LKSKHLIYLALLAAASARGAYPEAPPAGVEHPVRLELSPLSPSVTDIPLPTPQNTFVSELEGLSGRAPNFFVSGTGRHSFGDVYSVRGLTNGRLFTDPSVGLYVDGVPVGGGAFTYAEPLYAIDHVDLLHGPQATLFGLNAEGGLLEIHTRHADPQAWHGELSGLYGDFRTIEHRLWVGGPLIKDKLTLEISGFEATSQGFIDNTFLGGRRDDRETLANRAVLTWTPTKEWEITAGYEGSRARDGSSRFTRLASDPFQVRSDEEGSLRLNQTREWLTIGRKFDTWEIRSVTAHRSWEVDPVVQDLDRSPNRVTPFQVEFPETAGIAFLDALPTNGAVSTLSLHDEVWSQEFRVQSRAAAGAPWWKAGLFFQHERTTGERDLTRGESVFESQIIPLPATFSVLPVFIQQPLGFRPPPVILQLPNFAFRDFVRNDPLTDHTHFELHEESWAGYLSAGHHWGALEVAGGVRTTYTRKTLERDGYTSSVNFNAAALSFNEALLAANAASLRLPPGAGPGAPIDLLSSGGHLKTPHRFSAEDDDVNFTPSLGLTYDLPKHLQLFARSSYIVKPGGFNPLTTSVALSQYGREEIWANEAGLRGEACQGRLQAQLTGYLNRIEDYQLDAGGRNFTVLNAGRARAMGLELEAAWQLMPGLALSGSVGWNDTELTQAHPDHQAPYVPRYTALVALDYRHRCGIGGRLEFKALGDTEYSTTNLDAARQGAYGETNARLGYEGSHYGIYLFGRNLTDTKRYTQKDATLGGSTGEPRILGVMAALKF
jgi:outer membrane receptor protein involved in Fe transport